jgi:hypothetical protein
MRNQRLAMQAGALQKNPAEAEVILRMSVIANAITAIGRTFDRPSAEMISAGDQRDMVCRRILVASYLNEAVIILNKRHDGLAWKQAATGVAAGRSGTSSAAASPDRRAPWAPPARPSPATAWHRARWPACGPTGLPAPRAGERVSRCEFTQAPLSRRSLVSVGGGPPSFTQVFQQGTTVSGCVSPSRTSPRRRPLRSGRPARART